MRDTILLSILVFTSFTNCFSQGIEPAPEDKSVVYFVRKSGVGAMINFTYFDSTKFVGKFNGKNYIRYVCDPGKHLFWARSENKSFVEAEINPGEIYFLEAIPNIGWGKARVELISINASFKSKTLDKILKLVNKKPPEEFNSEKLEKELEKKEEVIERGFKNYAELKAIGEGISHLEKNMSYKE